MTAQVTFFQVGNGGKHDEIMVLTEESQDDMNWISGEVSMFWPCYPENIRMQNLPGLQFLAVIEVSVGKNPKLYTL